MGKREKKIAVIQEYLPRCNSVYSCYVYGHIPNELINNACMSYAGNVKKENVFGLIDETLFNSGKKGFLFTENGFYSSNDNAINKYEDGITYRSLPSSYNITAFNEMLTKLYEIETALSGWDIAGGLLDLAVNFLQEIDDASDESEEQIPASPEPAQIEAAPDCDEAKQYIKEILLQVNDVLECEQDDIDDFVDATKALMDLMEESDGKNEQAIDALLSGDDTSMQMQKASAKCQQGLELYLPEVEDDPDSFETCRKIVKKYQQTVKQIRTQLKQL